MSGLIQNGVLPQPSRIVIALFAAAILAACAADAVPPQSKPRMTSMNEPLIVGPTDGNFTYTNEPQLTKLGPHRFMIPANYFTDQIGPDFQGGALLELVWPTLEAAPPGWTRTTNALQQAHLIRANLDYIDRWPLQNAMDSSLRTGSDDPILRQDPTDNIDYRTRMEDVLGLERWVVSEEDKARYLKLTEGQSDRYGLPADPWDFEDWYLRRDAQGHVLTRMRCDPPAKPDGLVIQNDALVKDGNPRVALCAHAFSIPKYDVKIDVRYPRVVMHDWKRIEARFRAVMDRYYVGTEHAGDKP